MRKVQKPNAITKFVYSGLYFKDGVVMKIKIRYINYLLVFISISTLSYFISVREVGTDTEAYIAIFHKTISPYSEVDKEILYVILNKAAGFFSNDHRLLFFLSGFISLTSSWFLILFLQKKIISVEDDQRAFSVILFSMFLFSPVFLNANVNVVRQGLATPFLIVAFIMLLQKKYIFSLVFFLISIGFHKSSLIFALVSPVVFLDYKKVRILIVALSVLYLSGNSYFLIESILGIVGLNGIFYNIQSYGSSSDYSSGVRLDFFMFTSFFLMLAQASFMRGFINDCFFKILMALFIPFLLIGYMAYSDRLLIPLWYLIPVIFFVSFVKVYENLIQKNSSAIPLLFLGSVFFTYRII